jgi:hypothetical protein
MSATRKPKTDNPEARYCGCSCGEPVRQNADYRPGHDARHASQIGRTLAANPKDRDALAAIKRMSPPLRAKAERIRDNAAAKAKTRA